MTSIMIHESLFLLLHTTLNSLIIEEKEQAIKIRAKEPSKQNSVPTLTK